MCGIVGYLGKEAGRPCHPRWIKAPKNIAAMTRQASPSPVNGCNTIRDRVRRGSDFRPRRRRYRQGEQDLCHPYPRWD